MEQAESDIPKPEAEDGAPKLAETTAPEVPPAQGEVLYGDEEAPDHRVVSPGPTQEPERIPPITEAVDVFVETVEPNQNTGVTDVDIQPPDLGQPNSDSTNNAVDTTKVAARTPEISNKMQAEVESSGEELPDLEIKEGENLGDSMSQEWVVIGFGEHGSADGDESEAQSRDQMPCASETVTKSRAAQDDIQAVLAVAASQAEQLAQVHGELMARTGTHDIMMPADRTAPEDGELATQSRDSSEEQTTTSTEALNKDQVNTEELRAGEVDMSKSSSDLSQSDAGSVQVPDEELQKDDKTTIDEAPSIHQRVMAGVVVEREEQVTTTSRLKTTSGNEEVLDGGTGPVEHVQKPTTETVTTSKDDGPEKMMVEDKDAGETDADGREVMLKQEVKKDNLDGVSSVTEDKGGLDREGLTAAAEVQGLTGAIETTAKDDGPEKMVVDDRDADKTGAGGGEVMLKEEAKKDNLDGVSSVTVDKGGLDGGTAPVEHIQKPTTATVTISKNDGPEKMMVEDKDAGETDAGGGEVMLKQEVKKDNLDGVSSVTEDRGGLDREGPTAAAEVQGLTGAIDSTAKDDGPEKMVVDDRDADKTGAGGGEVMLKEKAKKDNLDGVSSVMVDKGRVAGGGADSEVRDKVSATAARTTSNRDEVLFRETDTSTRSEEENQDSGMTQDTHQDKTVRLEEMENKRSDNDSHEESIEKIEEEERPLERAAEEPDTPTSDPRVRRVTFEGVPKDLGLEPEDLGVAKTDKERLGLKRQSAGNDSPDGVMDVPAEWFRRPVVMVAVLLVLVVSVACGLYQTQSQDTEIPKVMSIKVQRMISFTKEMDKLKGIGVSQTSRAYATISASIKRIIQDDPHPVHPAVIMLASSGPSANTAASCIANRVAQMATSVFSASDALILQASSLEHLSGDESKLKLDRDISAALQNRTISVVIHSLEMLQPSAAMMFHAFCDNIEAPYKMAVFIFTVQIPPSDVRDGELMSRQVEDYLQRVWNAGINGDNLPALLSRLANNIAVIKPEDSQHLMQLCPH